MTSRQIGVWVRPGASRSGVGGSRESGVNGAAPLLVVAVRERAVEGAATTAVLLAVAEAFGVPRAAVTCIAGTSSRRKILRIADPPDDFDDVLSRLMNE